MTYSDALGGDESGARFPESSPRYCVDIAGTFQRSSCFGFAALCRLGQIRIRGIELRKGATKEASGRSDLAREAEGFDDFRIIRNATEEDVAAAWWPVCSTRRRF